MQKYKNVIFDFDSTLVSIEGLDELAKHHGLKAEVEKITSLGMAGGLSFGKSLRLRWELLKPTVNDIDLLVTKYQNSLLPEAKKLVESFTTANINVYIVSGGIKETILPVAKSLGIDKEHVFAVCTTSKSGQLMRDSFSLVFSKL